MESNTLLLPLPSASEIVGDLEFKACLLVKALVGVAGNNVSTWRLQERRNLKECSPFVSSRTVKFSSVDSLPLFGKTRKGV